MRSNTARKIRRPRINRGLLMSFAAFMLAVSGGRNPVSATNFTVVNLNKAPLDYIKSENSLTNQLITNVMNNCILHSVGEPDGNFLTHRFLSAMPNGGYAIGQWIWDTQFMTPLLALVGVDSLIRGQIYENYWHYIDLRHFPPSQPYRYGMIPCMIEPRRPDMFADTEQQASGFSQIPIIGWGIHAVFQQTNDSLLLGRTLDYLMKFDNWYSTERDVDNDGLIEYGCYPCPGWRSQSPVQDAKFETFDYHVPIDGMKLTPHPVRGGDTVYGNIEGVDQTCFLILQERSIAALLRAKGDTAGARRYDSIVNRRVNTMQTKMWDPATKFFYSLNRNSDTKIMRKTPQAFLALTAGAATAQQATDLVNLHLMNPNEFWTPCPIPTVSKDDPAYGANYMWRGDMWPAVNYLVSIGLNNYGYYSIALQLAQKLLNLCAAANWDINERFDSQSGSPSGANNNGMSCSAVSMVVQDYYGIKRDFRTVRVPDSSVGRSLKLGKLEVSYPLKGTVNLTTAFNRRFTVVFPGMNVSSAAIYSDGVKTVPADLALTGDSISFTAFATRKYVVKQYEATLVAHLPIAWAGCRLTGMLGGKKVVFTILPGTSTGPVEFKLFDLKGAVRWSGQRDAAQLFSGAQTLEIAKGKILPEGVYLLTMRSISGMQSFVLKK